MFEISPIDACLSGSINLKKRFRGHGTAKKTPNSPEEVKPHIIHIPHLEVPQSIESIGEKR